MKKLFYVLFVLAVVCTMVLSHAVRITAQDTDPFEDADSLPETAPSEETASIQQTASLEEADSPETALIKIARTAICRDVVDREPVEAGESFESSVGNLFCFTKVIGASIPTEITHAWYYGDTEVARVNLPVNSTSWRTYSSKIILANAVGDWHVDVLGPDGGVLETLGFKIIP